jgi:predicted TIM-barrel fold metal-dependent hydrolase
LKPLVIDAHCHTNLGGVFVRPGSVDRSLARYAKRANEAGIDRTILMAPPIGQYRQANREVGAIVAAEPERYLGFLFVNPTRDCGRIDAMVDEASDWGARGIKVHWLDGPITREVAEVAESRSLPVLYDPRGNIDVVRRLATDHPDVDWIIPHLSSFEDNWRAQVALIDELIRLPNLYTDTSGVRFFDLIAHAVRRAGAHKIIFGSDGPFLHPGVELAKIHALKLPPDDEAKVLGGNISRVLCRSRTLQPAVRSTRRSSP